MYSPLIAALAGRTASSIAARPARSDRISLPPEGLKFSIQTDILALSIGCDNRRGRSHLN